MALRKAWWLGLAVLAAGCLGTPPTMDLDGPVGPPIGFIDEWRDVAPGLTPRNEVAVGQAGHLFFALGGNNPDWGAGSTWWEVYDAATNTWSSGPDFAFPVHHTAVVGAGDAVYVLGGFESSGTARTDTWKFDVAAQTWTRMADMPLPRAGHAAAAVGDLIVVVGGYANIGLHVPPVAVYDTQADAWSLGLPIPTPRDHLAAAAIGSKVYAVAGDRAGHGVNTDALEAYDVETGLWELLPPIPRVRGSLAAVHHDGLLVAAGGQDASRTYAWVDVYDPDTGVWHEWPDLQQARHGFGMASWGDHVYAIMGGPEPGRTSTDHVEAFGPWPVYG